MMKKTFVHTSDASRREGAKSFPTKRRTETAVISKTIYRLPYKKCKLSYDRPDSLCISRKLTSANDGSFDV